MKIFICTDIRKDPGSCILVIRYSDNFLYVWRHTKKIEITNECILGKEVEEFLGADYYDFVKEISKIDISEVV